MSWIIFFVLGLGLALCVYNLVILFWSGLPLKRCQRLVEDMRVAVGTERFAPLQKRWDEEMAEHKRRTRYLFPRIV